MASFLSNPEVQGQIQKLDLEDASSGIGAEGGRKSIAGRALESAFGWAGYETSVTKNAKKILEWMNSLEGMDARRKHALMNSPQQQIEDPIERVDANAQESARSYILPPK